ncbi:hypothetical protein EUGRSUZ_H04821 [Eucalyptus grandis]|uniref:Uncharacterized protein n=2 Tax=Eucalyptus grandis TaxID=71139 RepID=A0ACC3JYP8_EUCGR|nr:hypothetical protein EUGRSUZ_H04821 [Eucalyptus grandis]
MSVALYVTFILIISVKLIFKAKESADSHNTIIESFRLIEPENPPPKNPFPTALILDFEPSFFNNENLDPPISASHPTCKHNRYGTSTENTKLSSYSQVYTRKNKTQKY